MYVTYNDVTTCREEKKTQSHHLHVFLLFKTNRMNGRFIGFHQLFQQLDRITRIISTLQDKQNKQSLYRVSSTDSKSEIE